MTSNPSPADIRGHVDRILERARNDAEFGDRLKKDPAAALREAGLHDAANGEVSQEIDFAVNTHMRCTATCDFTTCWVTWCDNWHTYATNN